MENDSRKNQTPSPDTVRTPTDANALEQEAISNQLLAEQEFSAAEEELQSIIREGHSFGGVSYFKYLILGFLAIVQDAVDLLDLTGVGALIAFLVSLFAGALIIIISWITNTKHKKAQAFLKDIETRLGHVQMRLRVATQYVARGARLAKKSKTLRPFVRRGLRIINKTKRFIKRSPLGKIILGNVLDLIPLIGLLPLSTLSIYLAYRDEKKTLHEARHIVDDAFSS